MHLNVSNLFNASLLEASLTPRRVVREKSRVKSGSFIDIHRVNMNSQQLDGLHNTLAPLRVKSEQVYEDAEMVRNVAKAVEVRQELVNC